MTETRGSYRAGIVVTTEENTESEITHARSTVYTPGWRHQMKHFPRYWPFVRGIPRSPVNSPHKGQWRGALRFFDRCLNKRLSKQSWGWWFETSTCPLWQHYDVNLLMWDLIIARLVPVNIGNIYGLDDSVDTHYCTHWPLKTCWFAIKMPLNVKKPLNSPINSCFFLF